MTVTVYGIPNCGTVKKALSWLKNQGAAFQFVDLRKESPTHQQINEWVGFFGSKPMRNTSGGSYRALGEEKKSWSDEQWATAFHCDPMLLKRPIIERNGQPVLVGFRHSDDVLTAALL